MKVKTSITLPVNLLNEVDAILHHPRHRSDFIERVIREYLERKKDQSRILRDFRDLELLNQTADSLNDEAADVLSYQVDY